MQLVKASPHNAADVDPDPIESLEISALIDAALRSEESAKQELFSRVHRAAVQIARRRYPRRGDDFASSVALRTIERMQSDHFRALARFVETRKRYPSLSFDAWIRTLLNNSISDEIRALPEFARRHEGGNRVLVPRPHVELDDAHAASGSIGLFQRNLEVRRVMRWIHDPEFPPKQRRAILLWLDGHNNQEIAEATSQSTKDVVRLLRAARQRLRRRFEVSQ